MTSSSQTEATGLFKPDGSAVTRSDVARARASGKVSALSSRSAYRGAGGSTQELAVFDAPNLSANAANRWERQRIADRARQLVRDEAEAAAGVRESIGMVVGSGWRLRSLPDAPSLGISEEDAKTLGDSIERVVSTWATDPLLRCDLAMRHDFGGLLRLLWGEWKTAGESLITLNLRGRYNPPLATTVNVVDTARLSTPSGEIETRFLQDGVEMDADGAPIAYHIRRAHPGDFGVSALDTMIWDRIPRFSDYGRPVCAHGFESKQPGQARGVSPFAPLIETFIMVGQYKSAELQSALINALFGAFVRSGLDPQSVAEILGVGDNSGIDLSTFQDARATFYEHSPVEFMGTRIPVLMPGDSVELNTAPRQASAFATFYQTLMQSAAAQLGLFEGQMTGNFKGMNYSNLRGAFNQVWNQVYVQRADFGSQIVRPIILALIDEAEDQGLLEVPAGCVNLWDNPAAWCRSEFIGPARGQVDPEKEAKAELLRLEGNLDTRTDIAASHGRDFEDLVRTWARETALMQEHGINPAVRESALAPSNPTDAPPFEGSTT